MDRRTVCWFSAGAASAVATKLVLRDVPDAVVAYCETGAEHPDNARFIADCERWFGRPIERFIDEIPLDHPTTNPIAPACDFLCHLAEQRLRARAHGERLRDPDKGRAHSNAAAR